MKYYLYFFILIITLPGCRSDSDITSPDDGLPPGVPEGLIITFANDGEIILEWEPNREADLRTYHIYRSLDDDYYQKIASTDREYFLDDSLEYEIRYYYKISAEDYSDRESELSAAVSEIPLNFYVPDKPMNLRINGRNFQNKLFTSLKWYPGYESDIIGYNIYRSEQSEFETDSSTLTGFSPVNSFSDTAGLELYKTYYYKIRGVDRGQLIGKESDLVSDMILGIPVIIFPPDNSVIDPFPEFIFTALEVPAIYRIIVQTNEFFGEFWSGELNTSVINDTLRMHFNPLYLESNKKYYWRVAAYSKEDEPNSVSPQFNFTIKPE